jgi:tripartite-type tricarboxylate transporter receptor subunit TctC
MRRFALVLAFIALPAFAQTKTIRIVVPFGAGGGPDALARMIQPRLSENIGMPVIVDNRPGAGGLIAADSVLKSPPDGTSLFLADTAHYGINPALRAPLPYDPLKDFAPVIEATSSELYITVGASVPANSLQEFVALAKSRPGGLHYGSSGSGSPHHLAMELLKLESGANLVHVPYKGVAQSVPAILSGDVAAIISGPAALLGHHKAGRVRMLAAINPQRWPGLPEVPTAAEAGFPGVKLDITIGLLAVAGTSAEMVRRLNEALAKGLREPEVSARLNELGLPVIAGTPEQFAQSIRRQLDSYGRLVRISGAKAD